MNAGPGVERLIADWLAEEAPARAPDRVLEAAGVAIDRTRQRRLVAEWRSHPMFSRLAVAAVIAVVAVGGALAFGRLWTAPGPGANPSPVPTPSPTAPATVAPSPFTGACSLLTSEEAEEVAGTIGVGALPTETGSGNDTSCLFSDGGGIVLRVTWTKAGGEAAFATVRETPGVEVISDLGDEAVYDPATHTLHVRVGDAAVAIVASPAGATPANRRLAAEAIGELVAPRM